MSGPDEPAGESARRVKNQRTRDACERCQLTVRQLACWSGVLVLLAGSVLPAADPPRRPSGRSRDAAATGRPEKAAAETARNPLDELKHWIERSAAHREINNRQRDHESIREAFREVVAGARSATVRVLADDVPVAFGTIVSTEGYALTKASELRGKLTCVLPDRTTVSAEIVAERDEHDLALLKLDVKSPLQCIEWAAAGPDVGSILATVGQDEIPAAIGVASLPPRRIAPAVGFLGVGLEFERPRVIHIQPGSGADKAGLQVDDLVLTVNGHKIQNREALQAQIRKHSPGQSIDLLVRRGEHEFKVTAVLGDLQAGMQSDRVDFQNRLGGGLNNRRAGFTLALQHDTVIYPHECGGPLVDLDGHAVGINIARSGRVSSLAIPASVVEPLAKQLLAEARTAQANAAEDSVKVADGPATAETKSKAGGE